MQPLVLTGLFGLIALGCLAVAPRRASVEGFFGGADATGRAPGLWVLVLSQVTTWIFARSLMNAAILGYFYGIWGVLAYTAYYGSFLTGGLIVDRLRGAGQGSVQDWLAHQFGSVGSLGYNAVVALRLLSEVFANLLVVGLIFGALLPEVPGGGPIAMVALALIGLAYSAWGGLSAALRTDVLQMLVFLAVFGAAFLALILMPGFDPMAVLTAPGTAGGYNGKILLLVAFLQVFSYPAHDPVMMDRGFLADRATTRASFLHAFWISALCIFAFGLFGIQASLDGAKYEGELIGTWAVMFPPWLFGALILSLLISALSTLDSALSSAARLVVEELRLAPRSMAGGRVAMVVFMGLGLLLTFWGNQTLFDAVAVSGTASMFLTPVLLVGLLMRRAIAPWAYAVSLAAAVSGALVYLLRASGWAAALLPEGHKYEQLLVICVAVLAVGFAACLAGMRRRI
ncbi:sodium:proline symporter [Marinovum sp. 2_MG-2023]|uniref:sodium:proline symporter n=1 Tax=unclassified Marinovum TaxID=2647166 RepID=UPI0026E3C6D6|nr:MULTISPECIES: sodium:proline symporter [unclassified Marinovum]MDO6729310.1 sodium:proline symporter [Marinovum sp. 2_MG-2023]MDO6780475.1 sodium:proline symporter [Marinovum sp. 1_MG-2023]